jgi:hypothetical protein
MENGDSYGKMIEIKGRVRGFGHFEKLAHF